MLKLKNLCLFLLAVLGLVACSKSESDDLGGNSNLSGLQIYFAADGYEIAAGETIEVPFSISGVEGKTLTLTATTTNSDVVTKVKNNANYEGNISFTAPSVMAQNADIVLTLKAEDKANKRETSSDITIKVKKSEEFALAWVGDYKTIALKNGGSFKLNFTIAGASDKSVVLNQPTVEVSGGYTAAATIEDATKGFVTVQSNGALTPNVTVKLALTDNYNRKAEINRDIAVIESQSTTGASNCYIVAPGSTKVINAGVKGNSTEPIDFDYAVLVWQDAPSLVKTVAGSPADKSIIVQLNSGLSGNAVVAAVKGSDIVWSWHLWVTDYDPEKQPLLWTSASSKKSYVMMDRNLGAKTAVAGTSDCFGLLYQWGRKDPFLGAQGFDQNIVAPKYDIDNKLIPDAKKTFTPDDTQSATNLNYSIQHPNEFIYCNAKGQSTFSDWLTMKASDQDNDLWGYVTKYKTKYDPCPEGWRVAPSDAWGFRSHYSKSGSLNSNTPYDTTKPWYWDEKTDAGFYYRDSVTLVTYYFPMSGARDNANGEMKSVSGGANFFTPEPAQNYVTTEMFAFGNPASVTGLRRDYGYSIRCVKEYNY